MVAGTYLAAAGISTCAFLTGHAFRVLAGSRRPCWLSIALGYALLLAWADSMARLSAPAAVGLVGIALASAAGVALLWRDRRLQPSGSTVAAALATGAGSLVLCSIPFVLNGRVGPLSANPDFASHLLWTDELMSGGRAATGPLNGNYALGPHELAALVARVVGGVEPALLGLLLAASVITAVAAREVLDGMNGARALVGAWLVALPFLLVIVFTQGLFRETSAACLALAFALALGRVGRGEDRAAEVVSAVALAGGFYFVYGAGGMVWPLAILVTWIALRALRDRRIPRPRLPRTVGPALMLYVVILLPVLVQGFQMATAAAKRLSLDVTPIDSAPSVFTLLGPWMSARTETGPGGPLAYILLGGALVFAAAGVVSAWREGRLELAAGVLACMGVWVAAELWLTPYQVFKALIVASPLVAALIVRKALPKVRRGARRRELAVALAAGVVVAGVALASLRTMRSVVAFRPPHDLTTLRPDVHGAPTLYFGSDPYALWYLHTELVRGAPGANVNSRAGPMRLTPAKGQSVDAVDFDAALPSERSWGRFIVAPNTRYASAPSPNWQVARRTSTVTLWHRSEPEQEGRQILRGERLTPGAVLDCRAPEGQQLRRQRGLAWVIPAPVVGPAAAWSPPPDDRIHTPGTTPTQTLQLPAGLWELSLQYVNQSVRPVEVRAGTASGRLARNPSAARFNSEPPLVASFTRVLTVRTRGGPLEVSVHISGVPWYTPRILGVALGAVAAVRADVPERAVPLSRACGRYVDYYRTR